VVASTGETAMMVARVPETTPRAIRPPPPPSVPVSSPLPLLLRLSSVSTTPAPSASMLDDDRLVAAAATVLAPCGCRV